MKWKRLGRIFDPTRHRLPHGCVQFAQSPQALVFDDFVRIYFSTRAVDPHNGKYLSHVAFVDMQKDLRSVIGVSRGTVLPLGCLGCYDEHGIFPFHVLRHSAGVYGYISGWSRRISVSVETAIGLAVSEDDGFTFRRIGNGPVLAASPREPFLVGDPFVKVVGDIFHMWYIFGTSWRTFSPGAPAERTYKIGHASSRNGIDWVKDEGRQIVADQLGADESQALPSVIGIDGRHHMYFCYRQSSDFRTNPARGYRIGHAYSDDLTNWSRTDQFEGLDAPPGDWDSDMMCYPHVFRCGDRILMLYNGNEFGRYGFGVAELEP
ncbi:MAG: hypothetical protein JO133_15510 [Burkholderiaceae bacterium]|nr:hypothetical protein [Burkholderiaceae bacterium]